MENIYKTGDRVDVIRCRDCRYFNGGYCDRIMIADEDSEYFNDVSPDFFCAAAEKSENA